jgi:hypothetical protein
LNTGSVIVHNLEKSARPSVMLSRLATVDWRTLLAFALPFTLYVLTLAPTIYNLDSAEFTTAAATGGIVRATGYPLYLLLGRVWSWLPIGDVGYRMNLLSAFCGALTIAFAQRILRRLGVGPWATLAALGLLACAPYFWAMSLIAEVYALHTALMAAIVLLLLRWAEEPTPRRLALVGLVGGLSLGNHAATALLVPGAVWYVLVVGPRKALTLRSLLATASGVLLGLGIYLYLPLLYTTMPSFNYAGHYDASGAFVPVNLQTAEGLWWLVSGRTFAGEMFAYQGTELWHEIQSFGVQLWRAFFVAGIGPGLLGIIVLLRRDWRLGGMLGLMFALNAWFYIDYRVVDKDTMFLPTYMIWALWLGIGYQVLLDWVRQGSEAPALQWKEWLLRGLMVSVVLIALAWNWRLVDLSDDRSARARGEAILRRAEPDALVLGWWDTAPVVEYLQLVEGQRPDVQTINRFLISYDDLLHLIEREATRRPVYIDDPPEDLPSIVRVDPAGPVYRLRFSK